MHIEIERVEDRDAAPILIGGGHVELQCAGTVGTAYFVDAATNLVALAWVSLGSNL